MPLHAAAAAAGPQPQALVPGLLGPLRELGHLKRTRSAGRAGSSAERLFRSAWTGLVAGEPPDAVALLTVAAALAAARLGEIDLSILLDLGLGRSEAIAALERAFDEVAYGVDPAFRKRLRTALAEGAVPIGENPPFVDRLAAQPRAGVTCPGRPRLTLQPAENHAEHCLMVAVYGTLLAPSFDADPASVFVASLAHHLHNAFLPDSGFTGEMLLGPGLDTVVTTARERALGELTPGLAQLVRDRLAPIATDTTAAARAFHAADVLDRVLEIEQHLTAAGATMSEILGPYALVHDGPMKPFHDGVLHAVGLI